MRARRSLDASCRDRACVWTKNSFSALRANDDAVGDIATTENHEEKEQIDRRTTDASITLYYIRPSPFEPSAILLGGFPSIGDLYIFLFLGGYIDKRK